LISLQFLQLKILFATVPLRRMKQMYFAVIIITFIGQSCMQKETLTREEVVTAIQHFDNSWKNKNAKTVDSVLSPSYVYYTQSGGVFDRKSVVQTAGSPDYKLETMQREQFDIKIEDNTAVVNTIWNAKGSYFDTPFDDRQRCSITIIKKDGKVEILSEHCTPIK
jgi:hypothetical protein